MNDLVIAALIGLATGVGSHLLGVLLAACAYYGPRRGPRMALTFLRAVWLRR